MASGRVSAGATPSSSHLARLIEAESAIEARLAAAREEAERIVAAARAAADGVRSEAELAAAVAELRSRVAAETEARLAGIEEARRAELRVWQADDEVVARLARAALDRLLASVREGAP